MMNQEEHILVTILNLKLQCYSFDYPDAYVLVKGTITIIGTGNDAATRRADERDKGATFKNCAPFTKCIN